MRRVWIAKTGPPDAMQPVRLTANGGLKKTR